MEAELLRDTPAVGLLIAKFFWPFTKLFEYKVSGTLDEPVAEPVYLLPKVVLMPFNPRQMFKQLFAPEEQKPPPPPPQ